VLHLKDAYFGARLQGVPDETVRALAAACRTLSLANLRLTFPEARYWRRRQGQTESGSLYVRNLLGTHSFTSQVLIPHFTCPLIKAVILFYRRDSAPRVAGVSSAPANIQKSRMRLGLEGYV